MKVICGVPAYSSEINFGLVNSLRTAGKSFMGVHFVRSGILPRAFNSLLASALNDREKGATHFLLWHSDIEPQGQGWLDKMLDIMCAVGADVLSAISPIKDQRGLSSTALDIHQSPFWVKRLTMTELHTVYPATWTDPDLLVNTGLMLVDIRKSWIENVAFNFQEEITKTADGKWVSRGLSEDWAFSRRAKQLGASIWVTREIQLTHYGNMGFPNNHAWGKLVEDDFVEPC